MFDKPSYGCFSRPLLSAGGWKLRRARGVPNWNASLVMASREGYGNAEGEHRDQKAWLTSRVAWLRRLIATAKFTHGLVTWLRIKGPRRSLIRGTGLLVFHLQVVHDLPHIGHSPGGFAGESHDSALNDVCYNAVQLALG